MMQAPPPTQPQQPQKPMQAHWYNNRDLFLHGFVRSNYITVFTDWFMGLAGKLAEFVLYATVLYSGAELYPGVKLPDGLNLSVFILQMGALDIGGIGLSKLAKQAREDGNPEGAETAERLSKWLIRIMIAGIVTVSTEQVIAHLSLPNAHAVQTTIQVVQALVELVLVVARAICAVLYGKVVHALKKSTPEQGRVQQAEAWTELSTRLDTTLSSVNQRVDTLFATLDTLSTQITILAQQVDTLDTRSSQLDTRLTSVEARQEDVSRHPRRSRLPGRQGDSQQVDQQSHQIDGLDTQQEKGLDRSQQGSLDTHTNDNGLDSQLDTQDDYPTLSRQDHAPGKIIRLSRLNAQMKQPMMTGRVLDYIREYHREPSLGEIQGWGCAKQTAVNSREAARALLQEEQAARDGQASNDE